MTLSVACFADEIEPALRLAHWLSAPLSTVNVHRFPDGETMPIVAAPADATTVVYRSLDRPNGKLVDLILAADAWRRAGAARLLLVAPYLCYLRQDAVFTPGEPLSRDVVAPLIGARFDAVLTVQAHLHRTRDLALSLGTETRNLIPVELLAAALPPYQVPPLIVGPDAESAPWAEALARRLGGEAATLSKTRLSDRRVTIELGGATPQARPVVLVDDIASSGETLEATVTLVSAAGAASIDIAVVHALMDARATRRLHEAGARRIVSTDSVRHPTNAAELAPLLAAAVREMASTAWA
jgi:ribose-phosphate pyrophosphokinase